MIVITGAAGFIGSCLVQYLNELGYRELVLVDDFHIKKRLNLLGKSYRRIVHRDQLFDWLKINRVGIDMIFHLGARTDTTEKNKALFDRLNLTYSKRIWRFCVAQEVPIVYASSAATYGLGEQGFDDNHMIVKDLKPLNPYGDSKNNFDRWVLKQPLCPPKWIGLKFFNVYGPNEYHKGRMASVIFHTFQQIQETGGMKLFRSHKKAFKDGEQCRDFIYVKDVVKVMTYFLHHTPPNGLYNVGTGDARTFWDLAAHTFLAMGLSPNISFIDTPLDIRDTYQYFTQANMQKLKNAGYLASFHTLESGIKKYVQNYLMPNYYY